MSLKALEQRRIATQNSLVKNKLAEFKIDEIIKLRLEGFSYLTIAYLLKHSRNTVLKYCRLKGI